jgi:hypothetical protein
MRRMTARSSVLWFLLVCGLSVLVACSSETDEQLLAKIAPALQAGNFRFQPKALDAVSELLNRGNAKVKEPEVIDCLITTGALLLTDDAEWTNPNQGRDVYDLIKRYDDNDVIEGLGRKVIEDETNRLHVLFLAIKLEIPGSLECLNQILDFFGDQRMAEDFLNSGSSELHEGADRWASSNGYLVIPAWGSDGP